MRKHLHIEPSEFILGLGLFLSFVLLLGGVGFANAKPGLASFLIFLFSTAYLVASVLTKRAHFLYGSMLLGAVAYFMFFYAIGVSVVWFPFLAVPLVFILWIVAQFLYVILDSHLFAFPKTVIRAMNITVAIFTTWTFILYPDVIGETGIVKLAPGFAFLGFAVLYMIHCLVGAHAIYAYVFSVFMAIGAGVTGTALMNIEFCWLFLLIASGVIARVGTLVHSRRKLLYSRHFLLCFVSLLIVSFAFSLLSWLFVFYGMALTAFLLWQTYRWLAIAIGNVRNATTNERLVPRLLLLSALLLGIPLVPFLFVMPANLNVDAPAVIFGLVFAWIAWSRHDEQGGLKRVFVFMAGLFLSCGFIGAVINLPIPHSGLLPVLTGLALLGISGFLYHSLSEKVMVTFQRNLAEIAIFPVFFLWYVPFLSGEYQLALIGIAIAAAILFVSEKLLKEPHFRSAYGPLIAGLIILAALYINSQALPVWIIYTFCAGVAGVLFAVMDDFGKHFISKAANIAWLILSIAAIYFALAIGIGETMHSITAVGAMSVLLMGIQRRLHGESDLLGIRYPGGSILVVMAVIAATCADVLLVVFASVNLMHAGMCLAMLAIAFFVAWRIGRGSWSGYGAVSMFAFGMLLVVFSRFSTYDMRLAWGSIIVFVLFLVGALEKQKYPLFAGCAIIAGHLTSTALAYVVFVQMWGVNTPALPLAVLPYIFIYALMPRIRNNIGLRVGLICWTTFGVLFSWAHFGSNSYSELNFLLSLTAFLWIAIGHFMQKSKVKGWPTSLYTSATIITLFCCIVGTVMPSVEAESITPILTEGTWLIFLVAGMAFMSLFVILHENIFAYLMTLALSLMAFDWIKHTTTHFTQDLLVYLVVFAGILGFLFIVPYLRRLGARVLSLPVFSIFNWQGGVFIGICVIIVATLISSSYAVKATAHPKFCLACHNMEAYYESWQHSSHGDIECLQCHYEPGVEGHIKGKLGATVQVAKFITQAYGTQPHGKVVNASCTQVGCHENIENSDKTILFKEKIKFRHDMHLSKHPRGKELNCTSCHGQMVSGTHIDVTQTSCLTCHFYGRGDKSVATGECRTCHIVPGENGSASGELSFDHQAFLTDKEHINCAHCHSQVTQGDAAVSDVRCRSCHLSDKPRIKDQEEFHRIHVTKGHFDCLQCHDAVRHGTRPMEKQLLAEGNCGACHGGDRHTIQEKIYSGTAIPELETMPDFMYTAGVACDGCHTDIMNVQVGEMTFTSKSSGTKQCSSCHDEEMYGEMLTDWQTEIRDQVTTLQSSLGNLTKLCNSQSTVNETVKQAQTILASAKSKLDHVVHDGSYGAHNYFYISMIMSLIEGELDEVGSITAEWPAMTQEDSTS